MTPEKRFREFLMAQGKRLTTERESVFRWCFAQEHPFDVDRLVSRLSQRTVGARVSRSTIYRTLSQMVDAGLLRLSIHSRDRELYEPVIDQPPNQPPLSPRF